LETDYHFTQKLLIKDLNIEDPGLAISNLEKLQNWLAEEIAYMMDRDFQKLLNILYRIDVSEDKVKQAFADENPAHKLAILIIDRELKKVETRKKGGY